MNAPILKSNLTEEERRVVEAYEALIERKRKVEEPLYFNLYFHNDDSYIAYEKAREVLSDHLGIELEPNDPLVQDLAEKIITLSYELTVKVKYHNKELKIEEAS